MGIPSHVKDRSEPIKIFAMADAFGGELFDVFEESDDKTSKKRKAQHVHNADGSGSR